MSFEPAPSLDPDNPRDVAQTARRLVQKLAEQPDNRSTTQALSDRYFGSQFPDKIVRIAAEAVVVHNQSKIIYDGQELVLEEEHTVNGYCGLIEGKSPDDPPDLLEIREKKSDEVADLDLFEPTDD